MASCKYSSSVSGGGGGGGCGSPCGACKFLRRKCVEECIFAPYFSTEQGPSRFAAIHKVFGASNVSKLLLHLPLPHRCEAVLTISYEAQARIRDPVYGCVSHIFALQQQVTYLQTQLMQAKAQLAQTLTDSGEIQWTGNFNNILPNNNNNNNGMIIPNFPNNYSNDQTQIMNNNNNEGAVSPQSSLESAANNDETLFMNFHHVQEISQCRIRSSPEPQFQPFYSKKKLPSTSCHGDLGELQALALRMMRN